MPVPWFTMHSHSGSYCKHASGTLPEMIEAGKNKGYVVMGLSEHMPRYDPANLYPEELEENMTPADLYKTFSDYVTAARELQVSNRQSLDIIVGMETEWIDDTYGQKIKNLREQFNLEYIVGSVHHVGTLPIDFSKETYLSAAEVLGGKDKMYLQYFESVLKLVEQVSPEVIGHIDVIKKYDEDHQVSDECMQLVSKILRQTSSNGSLLELNSSSMKRGWRSAYPGKRILELALKEGQKLTLSDDSHKPAEVAQFYENSMLYLAEMGVSKVYGLAHDKNGQLETRIYDVQ
eukprot:Clim_evm70s134 gene=Clim_evmTU70s134